MLCVPAEAPDGTSGGPAQGTNPRKHETKLGMGGVCAPSRPRLHTRSMQVHEETRSTHGGRVLLQRQGAVLCGCADSRGWTLDVHGVDGDSPFATAEAPSWRPDVEVRVGTVVMLERAFCVL